jgi:hypothetical protein
VRNPPHLLALVTVLLDHAAAVAETGRIPAQDGDDEGEGSDQGVLRGVEEGTGLLGGFAGLVDPYVVSPAVHGTLRVAADP